MDAKQLAALALIFLALIPATFSVRNVLRIRQAEQKQATLEAAVIDESSVLTASEIALRYTEVKEAIEVEQERYVGDKGAGFYRFADDVTARAEERGLKIISASARGSGTDRVWDLTAAGSSDALMAYLNDLDNIGTYIAYPTVALQDAGVGRLEARLSLKLPLRPELKSSSSDETPAIIPPRIPRAPSRRLATLFGAVPAPAPAPADPAKPPPPSDDMNKPDISFVGRYTNAAGHEVIALKDEATGRVRRLSVGREVLGWTLLTLDASSAYLLIDGKKITIVLEVP